MKKRIGLLLGCALMVGQPVAYGKGSEYQVILEMLVKMQKDMSTNVQTVDQILGILTPTAAKVDQVIAILSTHTNLLQKILDTGNNTYASLKSLINTKPLWVKAVTEDNATKATFLVDFLMRAFTGIPQTYTGPMSMALTGGCAVYKKLAFDPWVESATILGYNVGQYISPYVMSKSWGDLGQEYGAMVALYCLTQPQVRSTLFQQGKKWVVDPLINGLASRAGKKQDLGFSVRGAAEDVDNERGFPLERVFSESAIGASTDTTVDARGGDEEKKGPSLFPKAYPDLSELGFDKASDNRISPSCRRYNAGDN